MVKIDVNREMDESRATAIVRFEEASCISEISWSGHNEPRSLSRHDNLLVRDTGVCQMPGLIVSRRNTLRQNVARIAWSAVNLVRTLFPAGAVLVVPQSAAISCPEI